MLFTGRYVYIEASGKRPRQSARLISPVILVSSLSTKCLSFWYHMYGPHVGSLNVYTNATSLGSPIWTKNGSHGNQWRQAVGIEIQMNQSYSVSLLPSYGSLLRQILNFVIVKINPLAKDSLL